MMLLIVLLKSSLLSSYQFIISLYFISIYFFKKLEDSDDINCGLIFGDQNYKHVRLSCIQIIKSKFPAKMETIQEQIPNIMDPLPKDPLTETIRAKYEALKSKSLPHFNLVRHYQTNNEEKYKILLEELKELTNAMSEGNQPDVSKFYPLIFGALEGSSGQQQIDRVLRKRLGITEPSLQFLQELVKGKVKIVTYGIDKKKFTNIRQVSNKETFESMSQLFDLKQIKNHRKICSSIKNYLKSMKKFKDLIQNSGSINIFAETSQQNDGYINFVKQQISFNKMKIPGEILGIDSQDMEEVIEEKEKAPIQIKLTFHNGTPNKKEVANFMKAQTASGVKADEVKHQQVKQNSVACSSEQLLAKLKEDDRQNKNSSKNRRTKQQIERERETKEKERVAKLQEKKKKQEQRLKKQHQRLKQKMEKQFQKEQEREAKQKEKEAKQLQRINKEKERQNQRLAKQAAKQAERIAKQKKNNHGQTLAKWFKLAQTSSPCKNEKIETVEEIIAQSNQEERDLARLINEKKMSISQLRDSFLSNKMQVESAGFEPYYSTVYTYKSRLQFNNFLVNQERFKEYIQPHDEYASGKYQDSSVEYQDLCGDCCDDQMSLEQEEGSYNSAIVDDSYVSDDQLSSLFESKDRINIKIDRGAQWSFSGSNNYTAERYVMFCCCQDEAFPLLLSEPQETNEMTINLKIDLYKQIHGSYGAKDQLIKRLANIAEKVPKSSLDNLIKETTTKRGNQRLVKPQIIDFLTQQRQTFAKDLEDIKAKRDEQNALEMKGKINEKEKEMERLILEEAGTYYIIDLLHFLREKGYRMRKRDLLEFIKARVGSQWDDVRKRMQKMQLKEKEKINQFLSKKDKQAQKNEMNKKSTTKQEKDQIEKIEEEVNKQEQDQIVQGSSQSQKNEKMQPQN